MGVIEIKIPTGEEIFEGYLTNGNFKNSLIFLSSDTSGKDLQNGGEYDKKKEQIFEFEDYDDFISLVNDECFQGFLTPELAKGKYWKIVKKSGEASITTGIKKENENFVSIYVKFSSDEDVNDWFLEFHHIKITSRSPNLLKEIVSKIPNFDETHLAFSI